MFLMQVFPIFPYTKKSQRRPGRGSDHQESLYLLVWPKRSVITAAWGLIGRNNIVSSKRIKNFKKLHQYSLPCDNHDRESAMKTIIVD